MKTSRTINKPEKKSKVKDRVNNKKDISSTWFPCEEDIREKANEIYLQRIERGEDGTAEEDWNEAEKLLSE
jgi:hypothetical protein